MKITVRRARPADVDAIRDLVRRATRGRLDPSGDEVFDRLAERGMLLAFNPDRELVGLISWRVENLVARILDLRFPRDVLWSPCVLSGSGIYPVAGGKLIRTMARGRP